MNGQFERAVERWRRAGVPLLPPASADGIEAVWRQLGQRLSSDVVALYAAVGGFERHFEDDRLWSLWSVERVAEENSAHPSAGVRFSDFLCASHAYAVRYEEPGRSSVWLDDFEGGGWQVAGGVGEFLARYLDDPVSVFLSPAE